MSLTQLRSRGILDGTITAGDFASGVGGKVLQVVYGTTSTAATSNSTTFADTGLTANITPSLTSSKVLILVNHNNNEKETGDENNVMGLKLFRGATQLAEIGGVFWNGVNVLTFTSSANFNYLDSPSSTSSLTYKTQFNNRNGATGNVVVQDQRWAGASHIILMEIGV